MVSGRRGVCITREIRHRVLHKFLVITGGEVVAHVPPAAFLAIGCRVDNDLGNGKQKAKLDRLQELGVKAGALVLPGDIFLPLTELTNTGGTVRERLFGAKNLRAPVHLVLQFFTDGSDALSSVGSAQKLE